MPASIKAYRPRILERDWGEEIIVAECAKFLGKILHMRAGTKGGLQKHAKKEEAFYLVSGKANVRFDSGNGLVTRRMRPGQTYHVPPGAVHQVFAVSDCTFFETSTPHYDDRIRMEKFYGLKEDGGLPTTTR